MKRYFQSLWYKAEKSNLENIFSLLEFNPDAIFLDCGCDTGDFTLQVANVLGTEFCFGIDIVKDTLREAQKKGIEVRVADLNNKFLEDFALVRFKSIKGIVKIMFYIFYRMLGLMADKIIVHSNFTKKIYIDAYKAKELKCFVIPIGVNNSSRIIIDDKKLDSKPEWTEKIKGKNIILYFGYILKRKGLELLIEAISRLKSELPNSVLVLAGGILEYQKKYIDYLKKMVTEKGLTKEIIFTGFLSKKEIDFLYNKCDFVVLPYTHSISSSLPLSLAFEAGKPVIASDIGTLRDEIIDNVNGLFFERGNLKELSDKIYLLSTNNSLLKQLQEGAKREFSIRSWDKIAKLTNDVIYSREEPN